MPADPRGLEEGPIEFRNMRERVSLIAKMLLAGGGSDAEADRAAANAAWTFGMVLVGVYQEANEIKHLLARQAEALEAIVSALETR